MIKFVSYNGKWPNLCRGALVVEKDNKQYSMENILISGGECGFSNNYRNSYINRGPWNINLKYLPKELNNDNDIRVLESLINDNIDWGCCGGCL